MTSFQELQEIFQEICCFEICANSRIVDGNCCDPAVELIVQRWYLQAKNPIRHITSSRPPALRFWSSGRTWPWARQQWPWKPPPTLTPSGMCGSRWQRTLTLPKMPSMCQRLRVHWVRGNPGLELGGTCLVPARHRVLWRPGREIQLTRNDRKTSYPFHSWVQRAHSPNLLRENVYKWGSENSRSIIIFHLSKLWKAKFFILCDVIFLVKLRGKFDIDHF